MITKDSNQIGYRGIRSYFPKKKYNRRVIVETINPVEKKKFEYFQEQEVENARREMKVTDIVYNIHWYMNYVMFLFIGFLESQLKAIPTMGCILYSSYQI